MANLLDNCDTCFEAKLNECVDLIVIAGGFTVGQIYLIIITDKFGNEYRLSYTADYGGNLTIEVADLPEGLFTRFSGTFTVQFYSEDGIVKYSFTINDNSFTCLKLSFKSVYNPDADAEITEIINFTEIVDIAICCTGETVEDGIIAHPGGGQADATLLNHTYNVIDTCTTAKDSCILDDATVGKLRAVSNQGAEDMELFPEIGERLQVGTTLYAINQSIIISPGNAFVFRCFTTGIYRT